MSGDLASGPCPTYAVVDISRKKKKVAEGDQDDSDIALYAVVDKTKKKNASSIKNYSESVYSEMEPETTGSHIVREQESYSVLHRDTASSVVLGKSSSQFNSFEDKYKRWKSARPISQLCLVIMVITISLLVLATAVAISVGISYTMISRLRSEIFSAQRSASNISLDDRQLNSVPCDLEHLENSSYINYLQLSESKKDVKNINMRIAKNFQTIAGLNSNDSHFQDLINEINNSNFNLFNLVNQLTDNVTLNRASLNQYWRHTQQDSYMDICCRWSH